MSSFSLDSGTKKEDGREELQREETVFVSPPHSVSQSVDLEEFRKREDAWGPDPGHTGGTGNTSGWNPGKLLEVCACVCVCGMTIVSLLFHNSDSVMTLHFFSSSVIKPFISSFLLSPFLLKFSLFLLILLMFSLIIVVFIIIY